ncbi:kelch repeat-containing protein [Pyxidicoccus xibeiensis]|uniref:kelch repeat-containing protein n=1 Tax=Pyxidicoccus xibeiensis TaxID=2906759 RepID=UPI0020A8241F|nr:kelch repeat-containing protein [Pyxidicoccus xibeiensis]MCP3138190.1 Ig-like domain-containing protein [Pyxidicoccus xibeiensis]
MTVEHMRVPGASCVPGARWGLTWSVLLCVALGCDPGVELEARSSRGAGLPVGTSRKLEEQPRLESVPGLADAPRPVDRAPALRAWREAPSEDRALALARAYFPQRSAAPAQATDPAVLRVSLAETEGGTVELATRGYLFKVRPGQGGTAPVTKQEKGARFYGARHFWLAEGGAAAEAAGPWLTSRVDDFFVVDGCGTPYRASYEVQVPEGIDAVRDAGEYLEFLDARSAPVLRLHYPVARDGAGKGRRGEVRLHGAALTGRGALALDSRVLRVELEVDLEGLDGPVLLGPAWSSTGSMAIGRTYATSTLLPDGTVLVAGGEGYYSRTSSAERYDPATGTWSSAGTMSSSRSIHTATLLPNGKVLVAGGTGSFASAELYDPAAGTWSITGGMNSSDSASTATLLPDGRVLVAGGWSGTTRAELYDPATETWQAAGSMRQPHYYHTATLLPDGRVLVAGGSGYQSSAVAELYDPVTDSWSTTGALNAPRYFHTATLLPDGEVLVAAGRNESTSALSSAELYDPATGTWRMTGALAEARPYPSAALLPDGRVLVMGGGAGSTLTERYDPATGTWTAVGSMMRSHYFHTATLLSDGRVLVAGGYQDYSASNSAEVYDPGAAAWSDTGSLSLGRSSPVATLLTTGRVLVVGGIDATGTPTARAELHDVASGSWSATGPMTTARTGFTVTPLRSGQVLVVGGSDASDTLSSAELYDPVAGVWRATGSLTTARTHHAAALLPDGRVLVTGGRGGSGLVAPAELYDPASGTWASAGSLLTARAHHTATTLPSGRVLVSGGEDPTGFVARAELYDPATGQWTASGSLLTARARHTATLLSTGRVLVLGGTGSGNATLASAELFNPTTGRWSTTGSLTTARTHHTATLLPSGAVMVAGGSDSTGALASVETHDPARGLASTAVPLATARSLHAATLLPDGRVMVAGGSGSTSGLASVEVFDDTGALDAWRPLVAPPAPARPEAPFTVRGSRFRGISEAHGGGFHSSATNFPIVHLSPMERGSRTRLTLREFSDTSAVVSAPPGTEGFYLLTVTVNAVRGGTVLYIDGRPPAVPVLTSPAALVNSTTPTIAGTAEAGSTVTVTVDRGVVGTALADASGHWSFVPASALAQGAHTVSVAATDAAGNEGHGTEERHFTVDSVAPAAPVLTSPDALIGGATPTVAGTAEADSTVEVRLDGAVVGTVRAASSGAWSLALTAPLAHGAHVATATATDAAGNASALSADRRFMVDTLAPEAPVLTGPAVLVSTVTPVIEGKAEPGSTVTVRLDGFVVGTAVTNGVGGFSLRPDEALAQGLSTATATATDAVGNTSAASAPRGFTVDTLAPAAPILTGPASRVATTTPTLEGTAEPGSRVAVKLDGIDLGSATANASGAWSLTPGAPVSRGAHLATAIATDAAGNASLPSAPRGFTVSSALPAPPVLTAPAAMVGSAQPTIEGRAEAGALVTVLVDGVEAGTVSVDAFGTWRFTPSSELAQGAHRVTATATDAEGNASAASAAREFTVDSVAPEKPQVLTPASGESVGADAVSFSGKAEAGSAVTVSVDGAVMGRVTAAQDGTWSFTSPYALSAGDHQVSATATDGAGNVSPEAVHGFQVESGGCGCSSSPTGGFVPMVGLMALWMWGRRRRAA